MRLFIVAAAAVFALTGTAAAQNSTAKPTVQCAKPPTPACVDDLTTYVSADKMIDCQNVVKEHVDATMAYLACMPLGDAPANAELMNSVARFNCRLQGRDNCG